MLQLYDYLDQMLADARFHRETTSFPYFASEVFADIGCDNEQDTAFALFRAIQACRALNVPVSENFKRVFCYNGEKLSTDWELSALGCYLLVMNGNPCHPSVARAQMFTHISPQKV